MPPYLAMPYFHLSKLPLSTKVALSCFYAAVLTALAFVAFAIFGERTHWRVRDTQANFVGDERVTEETGARFDRMTAARTTRDLSERIVHPHSFIMPILFFILVHLMEMSVAPKSFKIALYIAAFVAMMLTIFGPLLVYASISFAALMIATVIVQLLSFGTMIVVPAFQMWFGGAKA
jgi:hypothetical protein